MDTGHELVRRCNSSLRPSSQSSGLCRSPARMRTGVSLSSEGNQLTHPTLNCFQLSAASTLWMSAHGPGSQLTPCPAAALPLPCRWWLGRRGG